MSYVINFRLYKIRATTALMNIYIPLHSEAVCFCLFFHLFKVNRVQNNIGPHSGQYR